MAFQRGQVYMLDIGYGDKPWLVVSNNARNQALGSALVARITTTPKPPLRSIVVFDSSDSPLTGSVVCDDIETLYDDDGARLIGALKPATMRKVDDALRIAFGIF